jgi:poly-gamma-glutamate capsule biosynthesis protein CapA/YwtB (metallophosphatase superfamily)
VPRQRAQRNFCWLRVVAPLALDRLQIVRDYRTEIAHAAIDAGAEIVIGHGSHYMVQGIEVYRHRPIFYGIGEFFFPKQHASHGAMPGVHGQVDRYSMAVRAVVDGSTIVRLECMPVGPNGSDDHRTVVRRAADQPASTLRCPNCRPDSARCSNRPTTSSS